MAKKLPKTLKEAVLEEPERFLSYIDLDVVGQSENPQYEFMRQFEKAFGTSGGLNLWQYVLDNYSIPNELYENEAVQQKLPDEFKGSLDRQELKNYYEGYREGVSKKQKLKEQRIAKKIKVEGYNRKGKTIKSYSKTKPHIYTDVQIRFILSRKKYPSVKQLTYEFNNRFKTDVSTFGIRDKRLRLMGRK
jgi:hypothetical protein